MDHLGYGFEHDCSHDSDCITRQSYTIDFLTKRKKRNEGEIPQYYVEGDHEAIIESEVFDIMQVEVERRKDERGRSCNTPMASRITCTECGCLCAG